MILSSPKIDIKEDSSLGLNRLHFVFKGKFTEEASKRATQAWSDHLLSNLDINYYFIWDCMNMDGFEIAARKEWYRCMKIYKHRILEVTVISNNILIRGAARVMLGIFGIKSSIYSSLNEIS